VSGGFYFSTAPTNDWAPGWTPRTWANASTGVVHMYHGNQWGGWQFRLAARNDTASSLTFACTVLDQSDTSGAAGRVTVPCPLDGSAAIVEGGWQEARGGSVSAKSSFFVDNIKEELDAPGEWFFDPDEGAHGTLYLIPLTDLTGVSQPPDSSQLLVATVRKRIVTIIGNSTATPVRNVVLANVTVAHADATYLDQFEVPSGGDWAIHRGGAVFVDTAVGVTISGVTVDKVDGSGVFFSRYVRNSSVADSNFYEIGETAVLVVGASGKHRTNMASTLECVHSLTHLVPPYESFEMHFFYRSCTDQGRTRTLASCCKSLLCISLIRGMQLPGLQHNRTQLGRHGWRLGQAERSVLQGHRPRQHDPFECLYERSTLWRQL
jgi:hypothetical protein